MIGEGKHKPVLSSTTQRDLPAVKNQRYEQVNSTLVLVVYYLVKVIGERCINQLGR
jgi:hypothetical protein